MDIGSNFFYDRDFMEKIRFLVKKDSTFSIFQNIETNYTLYISTVCKIQINFVA